ncbi:hypothetical protein ACFVT5_34965 [Streptomyces sp. NPDC058001]|uniref:hypothetical protein n=1 Tax=Streptomyces sp. NPDC058001 TaxID=3346300 RepID=UPI0036E9D886
MSHLQTGRHIRTHHSPRKDYEPHTLMHGDPRTENRTSSAALKAPRRKHPALIHVLGTCLSVTSLLTAVIAAHTTRGR